MFKIIYLFEASFKNTPLLLSVEKEFSRFFYYEILISHENFGVFYFISLVFPTSKIKTIENLNLLRVKIIQ